MLLSVSADVKQATIVYVNEVPEVVVQDEDHRQKRRLTFRSAAETKSERCVKSAPVNPEKNISGQRNYNQSRRSSLLIIFISLSYCCLWRPFSKVIVFSRFRVGTRGKRNEKFAVSMKTI